MTMQKQLSGVHVERVRRRKKGTGSKTHFIIRDAIGGFLVRDDLTGVPHQTKGGIRKMIKQDKPSIAEIRKAVGLDAIRPVHVSPGVQSSMEDDKDELQKWYEEELREVYEEYGRD